MNVKSDNLTRLIQEIARFPGLGEKSAERLAMHIFRMPEAERNNFIQSILAVKNVRYCQRCFNFITSNNDADPVRDRPPSGDRKSETLISPLSKDKAKEAVLNKTSFISNGANSNLCDICSDARRDQNVICVVETHDDFRGIEKTGSYSGVYHILLGRIAPLEDCGPDKLTIAQLLNRIRQDANIRELILATNPTMEGDNTALYLKQEIANILPQGR
ncbi:MAG: toprim domain-containing protein, partial [Planctomycetota bacterium]